MADDDRSPEDIERDLARTRANLDETLDAIQRKLTPGELFEEALAFMKDSGTAGNLSRTIRDNPLPVLVIGVGVLWLLLASSRRRRPYPAAPLLDHGDYRIGTSEETRLQSEPYNEAVSPEALSSRPVDVAPPATPVAEPVAEAWPTDDARFRRSGF